MTLKQKAFVKALTDPKSPTYCKPSASYRVASPAVTPESSWVESHRMLRKPTVSAVVAGKLGLEEAEGNLQRYLRAAETVIDSPDPGLKLAAVRVCTEVNIDYLKMTGQIIDTHKVINVSDEERSAIRDLVKASMTQPASGSVGKC